MCVSVWPVKKSNTKGAISKREREKKRVIGKREKSTEGKMTGS